MCDAARFRRAQSALTARETVLTADPAYIRLLEAQSMLPHRYAFSGTVPCCTAGPITGLNAPKGIGPRQVDAFNEMLPAHFRIQKRAAQNRLHTPLVGRAPFKGLGDGVLNHPDTSFDMLAGVWVPREGNRRLGERNFDRFDHHVTIPRALRDLPVDPRRGAFTRMAPQYAQPRDEF